MKTCWELKAYMCCTMLPYDIILTIICNSIKKQLTLIPVTLSHSFLLIVFSQFVSFINLCPSVLLRFQFLSSHPICRLDFFPNLPCFLLRYAFTLHLFFSSSHCLFSSPPLNSTLCHPFSFIAPGIIKLSGNVAPLSL